MGSHEALNKASDKVNICCPLPGSPHLSGTHAEIPTARTWMQIREAYRMVVDAKASYLKEHPELDKGRTAETEIPKQLSPDTTGRSLTRKLSSRASFK